MMVRLLLAWGFCVVFALRALYLCCSLFVFILHIYLGIGYDAWGWERSIGIWDCC